MMRIGSPAGHSLAADHEGITMAAQTPATNVRLSMAGRRMPNEPNDLDRFADMVTPLRNATAECGATCCVTASPIAGAAWSSGTPHLRGRGIALHAVYIFDWH
jgi:hypothetical protein